MDHTDTFQLVLSTPNTHNFQKVHNDFQERVALENGTVSVDVLIDAVTDIFNMEMSEPTAQSIVSYMDGMTIAPVEHSTSGKKKMFFFPPTTKNLVNKRSLLLVTVARLICYNLLGEQQCLPGSGADPGLGRQGPKRKPWSGESVFVKNHNQGICFSSHLKLFNGVSWERMS